MEVISSPAAGLAVAVSAGSGEATSAGFGSGPIGALEGNHFASFGGSHVGGFASVGGHLGGLSAGRLEGAPLAVAPRHFASPYALAGRPSLDRDSTKHALQRASSDALPSQRLLHRRQ